VGLLGLGQLLAYKIQLIQRRSLEIVIFILFMEHRIIIIIFLME
jgi:hypothetical protein